MTTDWTQDSSELYRRLAQVAVPSRAEQIATLLMLIPFEQRETFRVVELASGEGRLSQAILSAFPNATLLALDGEQSMRDVTAMRLKGFGERARVDAFDMRHADWYAHLDGADFVVSSLCVHHLSGDEKQHLFQEVANRLSRRGAFIMADLVQPQREESLRLFAATWDASAREQSNQITGTTALFELFQNEHWNYYHYPDPFDQPSPLFDQLMWLKSAGFDTVDCFWMQAGHAIYGGYKRRTGSASGISFEEAMDIGRMVLR
jgi:tRNA (cmo5U34)-methyltransferase